VVAQVGGATPDGEQQHEAGQRRRRPAQTPQRIRAARVAHEVAIEVGGVGVRDDDVSWDGLTVR
jgi:hypothetical protein